MILARLAVSSDHQGLGIGVGMLQNAIRRTLVIAEQAGIRGILTHPLNVIRWQDPFGRWQRFEEKHNQADAFRTAQARARSTGKRHRLVDDQGHLLDLVEP